MAKFQRIIVNRLRYPIFVLKHEKDAIYFFYEKYDEKNLGIRPYARKQNMYKKIVFVFMHTAEFQDFFMFIFRKKNILHLSHISKRKLDIVIGL